MNGGHRGTAEKIEEWSLDVLALSDDGDVGVVEAPISVVRLQNAGTGAEIARKGVRVLITPDTSRRGRTRDRSRPTANAR
jgi:hypothetical protein